MDQLEEIENQFINGWGSLASRWGVNRTMAQISAYLICSDEPKTVDHIMERLSISRGNAHTNIKELVDWGFAKNVVIKGERKDFYTCEKDPWIMLCTFAKKRKEREIDPAIQILNECVDQSSKLKSKKAQIFHQRVHEINEFMILGSEIMNKIGKSEKSSTLKWFFKFLGRK